MNKYQLEELKNLVEELNINCECDNLEAEACSQCCEQGGGGIVDVDKPGDQTEIKSQE